MTDQERAVMQQALEALYEETAWFGPTPKGAAAITALRAALAQEPADHRVVIEQRGGRLYMNNAEIDPGTLEIRRDGVTYRSAERVAVQPEPVQEPVAWMVEGSLYASKEVAQKMGGNAYTLQALYIAPPQRPPLTDEEIAEATAGVLGLPHEIKVELARAIERKVRGETE